MVLSLLLTPPFDVRNAQASPVTTTVDDEEAAASQLAREFYKNGKYVRCAEIFEDLYESTHDPKYLYNAGTARQVAGHGSRAVELWSRYLDPKVNPSPKDADKVREAIALAKVQLREVVVSVEPANTLVTRLLVRYGACEENSEERAPIEVDLSTPQEQGRVHLASGRWCVQSMDSERWFGETQLDVVVDPSGAPLAAQVFLREREAPVEKVFPVESGSETKAETTSRRKRLALGLGIGSAVLAASGGLVTAVTLSQYRNNPLGNAEDIIDARRQVAALTVGGSLLGASLGTAVTSLTTSFVDDEVLQKRTQIGLAAGGGAALIIGTAWLATQVRNKSNAQIFCQQELIYLEDKQYYYCNESDFSSKGEAHSDIVTRSVAGGLIGIGTGLSMSLLASLQRSKLNSTRRYTDISITPYSSLSQQGLVLNLRF